MPLSNNGCKTINNYINLKNNIEFIKSLYENFKKNQRNFEIEVESGKFNVCISEKDFLIIENELINYIELKTENRFKAFIYEK
jgi:Fe-S cluster assembly iron-binding protein IscA